MTVSYRTAYWVSLVLGILAAGVAGSGTAWPLALAALLSSLPLLWFAAFVARPLGRAVLNWIALGTTFNAVIRLVPEGSDVNLLTALAAAAVVFVAFPLSQRRATDRRAAAARGGLARA